MRMCAGDVRAQLPQHWAPSIPRSSPGPKGGAKALARSSTASGFAGGRSPPRTRPGGTAASGRQKSRGRCVPSPVWDTQAGRVRTSLSDGDSPSRMSARRCGCPTKGDDSQGLRGPRVFPGPDRVRHVVCSMQVLAAPCVCYGSRTPIRQKLRPDREHLLHGSHLPHCGYPVIGQLLRSRCVVLRALGRWRAPSPWPAEARRSRPTGS